MSKFCDCEYGTTVIDYSIYCYMCGVVNAYYYCTIGRSCFMLDVMLVKCRGKLSSCCRNFVPEAPTKSIFLQEPGDPVWISSASIL